MTIKGIISINQPNLTVSAIDATDWAANGINLGIDTLNLYFRLRVTTSLGTTTLYDNLAGTTPDIVVVSAGQQAQLLNYVPTGIDNDILQGEYELTIRAEGSTPLNSFDELAYEQYTLNYEWPQICIKTAVFCDKAQVQSDDISDYGPYATNISRTHTLFPPPASGAAPLITSLPVNVYGPNIWSKTWTAQIISVVTFTLATNFQVYKQLENAREFEVICSREVCGIICCVMKKLNKYLNMWGSQKGVGEGKDYFSNVVIPGVIHSVGFLLQQNCGRSQAAANEIAELKSRLGCGDCDECNNDEPYIITPTVGASPAAVVVDSPLGTIEVTPEMISGTQYFHIEVSKTIRDILNNFKPVTITSDNLTYLTATPQVDPTDGHINWVLSPKIAAIVKNQISYIVRIYPNPSPAIGQPEFLIETTKVKLNGLKVVAPTFGFGSSTPNTLADYAILDVSAFFDTLYAPLDTPYEVSAQVIRSTDDKDSYSLVNDVECRVLWFDTANPNTRVQLYSPVDGQPLLLSDLSDKDNIYLAIRINVNDD